jgi:predicted hotdog family 3-hydroxylacyl-ACP dehydratase
MDPVLKLPLAAEELIPHRSPTRCVEKLLFFENGIGIVESISFSDNSFFDKRSPLAICFYTELMAQSFAAIQGYYNLINATPVQKGYLVGIRHIRMMDWIGDPEKVLIRTKIQTAFGGFYLADAEILSDNRSIASGSIKLWSPHSSTSKATT